ncbi:MAG: hypothetical protein WA943_13185 [Parvibaculum sp.]|uniref:hypothetical protein n=1 Tax=Parvibaculum sp. TaxID=2024848 RepID=UPI003C74ACBF
MSMPAQSMRYLAMLAATIVLCVGAALAFNSLVDPLWYFSGNRFAPVNFAFNERLSKANLIEGREHEFDCVIFGDSRATLLPEQKIAGYRCFNFAFSSGVVGEFVDYANWLKSRGFAPRLVIVGVSAGDFRKSVSSRNTPDFVREGQNPPSPLIAYASLDVLAMSWRTLFGSSPIDREYDRDFHCRVAVTMPYDPRKPIRDLYSGPFDNREPLDKYRELRGIFPEARFVGYAPPLSAWAIAEYARIGWLKSYTKALNEAATVFDQFEDYSVPSEITLDPANTYDGTHYSETVNATIAATLLDGTTIEALNLTALSDAATLAAYQTRLKDYSNALEDGVSAQSAMPSPASTPRAQ